MKPLFSIHPHHLFWSALVALFLTILITWFSVEMGRNRVTSMGSISELSPSERDTSQFSEKDVTLLSQIYDDNMDMVRKRLSDLNHLP